MPSPFADGLWGKRKEILIEGGGVRGYVQVKAYTNPLAVIDHNGKITYIAFFEHQTAVVDENGAYSDELLGQILSGELVNVKIHVEAAEKG